MNRLHVILGRCRTPQVADAHFGLTTTEAQLRLARDGQNAIGDVSQHPVWRALKKLWAPVPWMLESAILIQLGLGDYVEAGVVALLLLFNAGLGFFQEGRAQATLDALKSRLALMASVKRDGNWNTMPAAQLVAGDVVKLSLGAIVAADVRLLDGSVLLDQSMLTGESVPVESGAGTLAYAGALVRRGEAAAEVIATGERTKFGRTAELVRTATVESTQQKIVMRVVRNLAIFNGGVTILLAGYALWLPMPGAEIIPLILVAVLSSIPVALPSMFTLAASVGARSLASQGVLPTSLSAVDEAAGIEVLCADKTGTLTRNALAVTAVRPMPPFDAAHVLALAALASSDGGQDPVDAAIRAAAKGAAIADLPQLVTFIPFDPAVKRSEATLRQVDGAPMQAMKGAFAAVAGLAQPSPGAASIMEELEAKGLRVLAVIAGPANAVAMMGLIALSDPPRDDSAALVTELGGLGVRTVMVTGDAAKTAKAVAGMVGISGPVWAQTPMPDDLQAEQFSIFAGVLPEDKYHLVKALQKDGHIVGMCGDGANDAPALRQAQMGIAVSTATDVAKSAAGIVLTELWTGRHRRRDQGGADNLPAHSDIHAAIDHSQDCAGALSRDRSGDHRTFPPYADADGADDGHGRFSVHVVFDRQCSSLSEAQCMANPQPHDCRCYPRLRRSAILCGQSRRREVLARSWHWGSADFGRGDTGLQRPGRVLRRA